MRYPHERSSEEAFAETMGVLGLILGTVAAIYYARGGLTLSHYDAKAHLVVARRILDSLTPGWAQVGAVWLPLPHLLNAFPVQFDVLYRTGASAVAISVASVGLSCYALARLALQVTRSRIGASVAVALFALDPNVLYLQATPMTEALLLGLTLLGADLTLRWIARDADRAPRAAGLVLAAACLTRYEAWPVTVALSVISAAALIHRGIAPRRALVSAATLALYPLAAVALFIVHSRVTIGEWFVTGGFFVPDNAAMGQPIAALVQVAWGLRTLAGNIVVGTAVTGVACVAIGGLARRRRASQLVVLSLLALAALPLYAFYQGHPIRIRYMVPALSAVSLFAGIAVGSVPGRLRVVLGVVALVGIGLVARPLDPFAPMILEAQWDRPNSIGRRVVTGCLVRGYKGEPILVSMGALAHYMQELSAARFEIRDFVHEGNNQLWHGALAKPRGRVGWILIEERAEGGDALFARAKAVPELSRRLRAPV